MQIGRSIKMAYIKLYEVFTIHRDNISDFFGLDISQVSLSVSVSSSVITPLSSWFSYVINNVDVVAERGLQTVL